MLHCCCFTTYAVFFLLAPFVVASELSLLFGRPLAVAFGLGSLLYLLDLLHCSSLRRSLLNYV